MLLYDIKASSLKQADLRGMVKKASKYVCTSLVLIAPDPLSHTASTSSDMKPPGNTEENRHCLNQQMKEIHSLVFSLEGWAWQEPEPNHVTGMALAHCILGKFLGVVCHCFPPPLDVPTLAARCLRPQRRERS